MCPLQLWWDSLDPEPRHALQKSLNLIFEEEQFAWVFCDREFFQIDSQFLQEKVLAQVHELLTASGYHAALQEFVEARNDYASGDHKAAILKSNMAFESVMKVILDDNQSVAGDLIKQLQSTVILHDVPENVRKGFSEKILQSVPFLRNKLAAHGQGSELVQVSRELAELCLHLSGSIIIYCIRRKISLDPRAKPKAVKSA